MRPSQRAALSDLLHGLEGTIEAGRQCIEELVVIHKAVAHVLETGVFPKGWDLPPLGDAATRFGMGMMELGELAVRALRPGWRKGERYIAAIHAGMHGRKSEIQRAEDSDDEDEPS